MKTSISMRLHTMMEQKFLWVLLAVGMTVLSTGVVNAQGLLSKMGFLGEFRKKSIVGSWEELVRFPSGPPISQQRSVTSFHDDGNRHIERSRFRFAPAKSDGSRIGRERRFRRVGATGLAYFRLHEFSGAFRPKW
jgi:hypothetical protein